MKKFFVVLFLAVSIFVLMVTITQASDSQCEIRNELVAALSQNRALQTSKFLTQDLQKFFAPAFSSEAEREKFLKSIDSRIKAQKGVDISVVYHQHSLLYDCPMLTFEIESGGYLYKINVLPNGVVWDGETTR